MSQIEGEKGKRNRSPSMNQPQNEKRRLFWFSVSQLRLMPVMKRTTEWTTKEKREEARGGKSVKWCSWLLSLDHERGLATDPRRALARRLKTPCLSLSPFLYTPPLSSFLSLSSLVSTHMHRHTHRHTHATAPCVSQFPGADPATAIRLRVTFVHPAVILFPEKPPLSLSRTHAGASRHQLFCNTLPPPLNGYMVLCVCVCLYWQVWVTIRNNAISWGRANVAAQLKKCRPITRK